jgi:hypothetical protein
LFDTRPAERNGDDPAGAPSGHETRNITWTHFYAKEDTYSRIDYIGGLRPCKYFGPTGLEERRRHGIFVER